MRLPALPWLPRQGGPARGSAAQGAPTAAQRDRPPRPLVVGPGRSRPATPAACVLPASVDEAEGAEREPAEACKHEQECSSEDGGGGRSLSRNLTWTPANGSQAGCQLAAAMPAGRTGRHASVPKELRPIRRCKTAEPVPNRLMQSPDPVFRCPFGTRREKAARLTRRNTTYPRPCGLLAE
jgi:hypothetical protein